MDNQNHHVSLNNIDDARIYGEAWSGTLLQHLNPVSEECLNFRTPESGDNVLHIACRHNHINIIEHAVHNVDNLDDQQGAFSSLLFQRNSVNETPLHTAVRYGHIDTIKLLVQYIKGLNKRQQQGHGRGDENCYQPWLIINSVDGDTVLHVAIRNGYQDIAHYLMKEADPELTKCVNKAGESPLYLAAENLCYDTLKEIMSQEGAIDYSVSGPNGQNPLHAAIKGASISACKHLIEKRSDFKNKPDGNGKKPLHLAVEYAQEKVVNMLLKDDTEAASAHDTDGLTPLLRAATKGYFPIIKSILTLVPNSAGLRDSKHKRNVIHLAHNMSFYRLRRFLNLANMKSLVNEQDKDGNTPLHLSILQGDKAKAIALLEVQETNWRIKNFDGKTPLDLLKTLEMDATTAQSSESTLAQNLTTGDTSTTKEDTTTTQSSEPTLTQTPTTGGTSSAKEDTTTTTQSEPTLEQTPTSTGGTPPSAKEDSMTHLQMGLIRHAIEIRDSVLHPVALKSNWGPSYKRVNLQKQNLAKRKAEDLKKIMDGIAVIATLVVTLTFAAAFTVPGGYNDETGSIVLIRKPSLKVFFYSDTIAMLLCTLIMLDYAWAFTTVRPRDLGSKVFKQTLALSFALILTIMAFISGLYAVVPRKDLWLMHSVSVVTFLLMTTSLFFLHPINLLFLRFPINISCLRLPIIFMGPLTSVGITAYHDFMARKDLLSNQSSEKKLS